MRIHGIICKKCKKTFWQVPDNHFRIGCGCPQCSIKVSSDKRMMTKEQFIKRSIKIHGNKYNYSKVEYKGCDKKVCIICDVHKEFWQTPMKHLSAKCACKKCSSVFKLYFFSLLEP